MIRHVLTKLGFLRSTFAVGVGVPFLIAASAFAQDPAPSPVENQAPVDPAAQGAAPGAQPGVATTERVIVTGSYIPTAETESALPVTVYTAEVLQKQGANMPVEGLRQLPSFVGNAETENDSNGGTGRAGINLRSMGQENTLVLMNGRRLFLGREFGGQPDINAIPISALARTEVLKDGASAIYGSDAVAGVVNFIMLNGPGEAPYEGAELFALYGNTTENDGHVRQVYLRGGVKTDKVSVAAAGEYYSRANIYSRDRAKLAGTGDLRSTPNPGEMGVNPPPIGPLGRGGLNGNSPTFAGRVNTAATSTLLPGVVPAPGVITGALVQSDLNAVPAGVTSYRQFDVIPGADPARFNFRAFTPAIPAQEKAMYYITGRYKIFGEALQIYGDLMYSKMKQDNGLAPSPFSIPLGAYINASVVVPHLDPRTGMPFGPIAPDGAGGAPGTPIVGTADVSYAAFTSAAQRAIIQNSPFNPFGGRDVYLPDNPGTAAVDPLYVTPAGALISSAYRIVQELGNRRSFFDHDYYRYVGGLNGDFNFKDNGFISHFGYDAGYIYERYDQLRIDSGDASRGQIYREIIAGNFNPFIGQYAPAAGTAPTYTATGAPTGMTAAYDNVAAVQRAAFVARTYFYEKDWLIDAKFNAHLFPNMYNGGIDFAAGYEHRNQRQEQVPDPTQEQADQLGFNAAEKFDLQQNTDSVFLELTFPIVTSTMNVPFIRSLEISGAWRYEKFEVQDRLLEVQTEFENINPDEDFGGSPRLSIRYQPIADLTLRANFNQSYRSPTPFGLFSPVQQNFPQVADPYTPNPAFPGTPGAPQFVTTTLQPPGGVWQGGNITLTPELTDSYSAGLVYTPKWLPGFTVTADWYQLYTKDVFLPAASAAQLLLTLNTIDPDGPGGPPAGAPAIGVTRFPDGRLDAIDSVISNAAKRLVQGIDVTAVYELPTQRIGTFTFSLGWNHFFTWKIEPVEGLGTHNFLGDFSAAFPLAPGAVPFNKGFLRLEWNGPSGWMKGLNFIATMNYIGDFEDDPSFILGNTQIPEDTTPAEPAWVLHHRVSSYETLDLQLRYTFIKPEPAAAAGGGYAKDAKGGKGALSQDVAGVESSSFWQRMLWDTTITVGCNNVFDRYPPTVLGAFNDNYDTSLYSIRNRYYYISLTKKF